MRNTKWKHTHYQQRHQYHSIQNILDRCGIPCLVLRFPCGEKETPTPPEARPKRKQKKREVKPGWTHFLEVAAQLTDSTHLLPGVSVPVKNNPRPIQDVRSIVKRTQRTPIQRAGYSSGRLGSPVCLFSTWVCRQNVAEFRWLDSHSWLHSGAVRPGPHWLWGLADSSQQPDRPHVGSGIGVPFWYSAAVPSGSRWWVTAAAA